MEGNIKPLKSQQLLLECALSDEMKWSTDLPCCDVPKFKYSAWWWSAQPCK